MRAVIAGSGAAIPPRQVTNAMLARIMDTSDAWIRERSGVESRHYVEPGTATSDLGAQAARQALESAGLSAREVDLVVFATMTPDHFFPGAGGLLQAKMGIRDVPCFDIRQQCVGFLYGLQLVDAHIRSGLARTALLVGAEVHTGFMPWTQWDYLFGRGGEPPTEEQKALYSRFRDRTVLFGDAGGACVLRALPGERGVLGFKVHSDGHGFEAPAAVGLAEADGRAPPRLPHIIQHENAAGG